jgi:adenine-specific DNA-methyltransferase
MQKMNGQSADILADNIDQLKALFPEAFTEGKQSTVANGWHWLTV